ncbi:MAG: glycosyltransferase family 2 protein [Clostridia bacterium]|nr:glycosyltransferase family 2 protein [Clostridia bacterium]
MGNCRISACMVLYHSGEEAMRALECLEKSTVPVDVHIVDNSPETGDQMKISWRFPGVHIHQSKKNLGFGRGNNLVLPELDSDYHLLINPDVTFEPDLLARMMDYMDRHRDAVILTPRVFNADGSEQFLPKKQPTVRYLAGGFFEKLGTAFARLRQEYTMADKTITRPVQVEFATGCFLLIRTEAFRRLGGFDERFFLYQEDSDLSRRASSIGTIIYHPDMHITHEWARENVRTLKGTCRQLVSVVKYFAKWGLKW